MTAVELPALVETMSSLAVRANELNARIEANDKASLRYAIEAGEVLLQAKALCVPGEWTAWITANVDVSVSRANVYMRIATYRDGILERCQSIGEAEAWLMGKPRGDLMRGDTHWRVTDELIAGRSQAQELRAKGKKYSEIASHMGISTSRAWKYCNYERVRKQQQQGDKRRRAEAAAAKQALARQRLDATVKRVGGNVEVAYEYGRKMCQALERASDTARTKEERVALDAALRAFHAYVEPEIVKSQGIEYGL